jgi:hypothetical protein
MATEASLSAGPAGLNAGRGDAFYRVLVEGMNDGVLTRDADGVITYESHNSSARPARLPSTRVGLSADWGRP